MAKRDNRADRSAEIVLFVGPQYKNHRGGMGAVLASYAVNMKGIQFIATFDGRYCTTRNIGIFIIALFKLFWKLMFDRKIAIVHIHSASAGSFVRKYLVFLVAKFLFQKKTIYHLHGARFHLFYKNSNSLIRRLVKHLAESVDVFICLSIYWQNYLSNESVIKNLVVVNNPVLRPTTSPSVTDIDRNIVLNMLFLGRIGERKGVFDLLEVINSYKEQLVGNVKLRVGGDGEVESLRNYIENENLSDIVEYVGWVDGQKKNDLLLQCNVLILPSYNEGLPISILEAMSYGKAIIATTVGGIPEIVSDNENGFLFTPGDKETLAFLIKKFTTDPELIKR